MKEYPSRFLSEIKKAEILRKYRKKRIAILVISFFVLIILYMFKNYSSLLRTFSAIGFLLLFYLIDHLFDADFSPVHYVFVVIIDVSSFLLSPLYYIYPNYDKIQHLVQPVLISFVVMHLVSRLKIRIRWKLAFVFFIVIGFIGLHEIGEYVLDYFFDLKLQGVFLRNLQGLEKYDILLDRLDDTMIDMTFGVAGTLIYLFISTIFILRKKFEIRREL